MHTITVGSAIARTFTVMGITKEPFPISMSVPIEDAVELRLDSAYENMAFLSFLNFTATPPPIDEWKNLVFAFRDERDFDEVSGWEPRAVSRPHLCLVYKMKGQSGRWFASTQMIAAQANTLVSAKLIWLGMPLVNRFKVDIKPGMRERTEELLLAGLDMVEQGLHSTL